MTDRPVRSLESRLSIIKTLNERVSEGVEGSVERREGYEIGFCEEGGELLEGYIGRVVRQSGYNPYGGIDW